MFRIFIRGVSTVLTGIEGVLLGLAILCNACGPIGNSHGQSSNRTRYALALSGPNVIPIEIGGNSLCGKYGYPNEPCVSVTVCVPGTRDCQTLHDILLDTGSTGLRIFSSALRLPLSPVKDASENRMAECASFGTGSTWGPLVQGEVILAAETPVQTSLQIIDSKYATPPAACAGSDTTPTKVGYNGILGVGLLKFDCGKFCEFYSNNQMYYACKEGICTSASIPVTEQLQNPVSLLPLNNNGLIVHLPLIPAEGAYSVTGALILGIGTQSNNEATGVTAYAANSHGNFITQFNHKTFTTSFIDSGSNGIFFPAPSDFSVCDSSSSTPGFLCPTSPLSLTAISQGVSGTPEVRLDFEIANAHQLIQSGNAAYLNLGGSMSGFFDWGLPFFFGKKIYIGIDGTKSTLGTGPYWAF